MFGTKCLATDDKTGISTNVSITLAFTDTSTFIYLLSRYHESHLTDEAQILPKVNQ